jgi:hypothetical protein
VVSFTHLALYSRGKSTGTHSILRWVDPSAGLDDRVTEKFLTLPGHEIRPVSRPARSQPLYRLRIPRFNLKLGQDRSFRILSYSLLTHHPDSIHQQPAKEIREEFLFTTIYLFKAPAHNYVTAMRGPCSKGHECDLLTGGKGASIA